MGEVPVEVVPSASTASSPPGSCSPSMGDNLGGQPSVSVKVNQATEPLGQSDSLDKYYLHLRPLLQSLRATLTNMEVVYERERETLHEVLTDADLRTRMLDRLQHRHCKQREPYMEQLTVLQQHIERRAS